MRKSNIYKVITGNELTFNGIGRAFRITFGDKHSHKEKDINLSNKDTSHNDQDNTNEEMFKLEDIKD